MAGTLYRKLFIYFLVVIVLSLVSVSLFSYRKSSAELDAMVQHQMSQMINNAAYQTDLYLKIYERAFVALLQGDDIRHLLELPFDGDAYEFHQYRKKIKEESINPIFIRNPEIAAVYAISQNSHATYYYNEVEGKQFKTADIQNQVAFFLKHTTPDGKVSILNSSILDNKNDQSFTLVRQVRGYTHPETMGILALEIRAAELSALWKGMELGDNGYFFIVDAQGRFIYHPDKQKLGTLVQEDLAQKVYDSNLSSFEKMDGNVLRMYTVKKSAYSGWSLVVSMPVQDLRKPISSIRTSTLFVGLFTFIVALFLAYRFGKSITDPIKVLKNGMQETGKGQWAIIPIPERKDEIVELMVRYNVMVNRLSELVNKVYQVELNNQEIELERHKAVIQSLKLQINPHFLYNTLETIVCYAFIQNSKEISEIVDALAHMLRYSVGTNLEETKVANELKHLLHYLVILRHRVNPEFEIDVAIKPEYLLRDVVCLTLQPLVENIFQHAFADGVEDYHFIRIDAGEGDGFFWMSVEDNGAGITADKLAELNEKLSANRLGDENDGKKDGIGLLNVHRRIQMVFGETYGLRIESEVERGTKIMLIFPLSIPSLKEDVKTLK
ncbi:histidine kinase [Paenibacillus alba]|uniref:sensor histidine kinase n=1 Tax=Paenibacillus alba TaxID=1197127 RepID=UPI001564FB8E|nr:sensor histidine kinase [Paenibacillus alba]NQX70313.1 histidine kinase [Paenibacillus alba]